MERNSTPVWSALYWTTVWRYRGTTKMTMAPTPTARAIGTKDSDLHGHTQSPTSRSRVAVSHPKRGPSMMPRTRLENPTDAARNPGTSNPLTVESSRDSSTKAAAAMKAATAVGTLTKNTQRHENEEANDPPR